MRYADAMHKRSFVKERAVLPRLVGEDAQVPTADGELRRAINLDHAASTPALAEVRDAVDRFLPWYSSIHRGAGWRSQIASRAYEGARWHRTYRAQQASRRQSRIYGMSGPEALIRNLAMRAMGGEKLLRRYDWLYSWKPPERFAS